MIQLKRQPHNFHHVKLVTDRATHIRIFFLFFFNSLKIVYIHRVSPSFSFPADYNNINNPQNSREFKRE